MRLTFLRLLIGGLCLPIRAILWITVPRTPTQRRRPRE
jgi:hypothetical protein